MLDIKTIREAEADVRKAMSDRRADADIDGVLALDVRRRELLGEVESLKGERNRTSREIGALKKAGKVASEKKAGMRAVGERISEMDAEVRAVEEDLRKKLLAIPNVPHSSVPVGQGETGNRLVREIGRPKEFDFRPAGHVEIAERLEILDLPRATRMTGSGFPLLVGAGARLQRALIQYMLDLHTSEHGYTEMSPPFVCNEEAMTGTGQLPKMADDMYRTVDNLYLIPTAEVPVTNYFRNEIIEGGLPRCFTAYTPCFRREAGAAGRETRGILRVHQFDKVELVRFVEPSTSYDELEKLLKHAEEIISRLGLAYRVRELCTGDLTFASAKCYDIEIWAPGQQEWLEVSSCSNFEAFQARRAGIRYRRADGKVDFVHTLNGSGVALPRLLVALLESGQCADGSVELPEVIRPYMNGMDKLVPSVCGSG